MNDIVPRYLCGTCQRGVLNRRIKHCLYCGAQLAAAVLFTPEEIVAADDQERRERETYALSAPAPMAQPSTEAEDVIGAARIVVLFSQLL
jgi:hypothetical protein